jgi:hypothetical protein
MHVLPTDDYARDFLEQILRAGALLSDRVDELADLVPEDAYPDESEVEVVLDLITETLRPLAEAAGERFVRDAVALVEKVQDKVLTDLPLSVELAGLRERMSAQEEPLD